MQDLLLGRAGGICLGKFDHSRAVYRDFDPSLGPSIPPYARVILAAHTRSRRFSPANPTPSDGKNSNSI